MLMLMRVLMVMGVLRVVHKLQDGRKTLSRHLCHSARDAPATKLLGMRGT